MPSSSFSLFDSSFNLDSLGTPPAVNDSAGPAVAGTAAGAQTSQPSAVSTALAGAAANAISGIGAGLGTALSGIFTPKPTYVAAPAPPPSSVVPIAMIGAAGLIALLLVLRK